MPTRMQQRGVTNSMKRPSPFASVGRQTTTSSTTILTRKTTRLRPPVLSSNVIPVPPVPANDTQSPESRSNNVSREAAQKIAVLSNEGHKQKVEIDRQKLVISGLQRNLEHMSASAKKDKQLIEELHLKLFQLKKDKGNTDDSIYSPSSDKALEERHKTEIQNLKAKFTSDYSLLENKYDSNLKVLKEVKHNNQIYRDRIKQFEKDVLSKSSNEVTVKKQMETVSAHAKRMVDENRRLKDELQSTSNAKDEIAKLKLNVEQLQNASNTFAQEIEKLTHHNVAMKKKLEEYENEIALIKEGKEHEIQRRKKAIKDLSAKSANLSQLKKEFNSSKQIVNQLKEQLEMFEVHKKKALSVLKVENKSLQDDLNGAINEKTKLQNLLNKMKQNYSILETSASKNSQRLPELENRLRAMESKYHDMKANRDLFSQQFDDLQHQQKQSLGGYEKQKNILRNEIKMLKEKVASLETGKLSDTVEFEKEIERLNALVEKVRNEASRGIKNAQIQVDNIQNQRDDLSKELGVQKKLVSVESKRATVAVQKLKHAEREREAESKQIAFLQRQLEDQRASSASESRRAEGALEEASRCKMRYDNEHDRAQALTEELNKLRHAHLKLSEKVQQLKLQSGESMDLHVRYEKERDAAKAALAELQNVMKEQEKMYQKVQYESKEKDFLFQKIQHELHEVQMQYKQLLSDASDAKENARLANKLKETEKELRNTLVKILKTEEATESAFTCLKCMNLFDKPITCIPCGHSFCEKCIDAYNKEKSKAVENGGCCPECDESGDKRKAKKVDYFIQNELLENLSSRFLFRKQAIESLNIMVGNLR